MGIKKGKKRKKKKELPSRVRAKTKLNIPHFKKISPLNWVKNTLSDGGVAIKYDPVIGSFRGLYVTSSSSAWSFYSYFGICFSTQPCFSFSLGVQLGRLQVVRIQNSSNEIWNLEMTRGSHHINFQKSLVLQNPVGNLAKEKGPKAHLKKSWNPWFAESIVYCFFFFLWISLDADFTLVESTNILMMMTFFAKTFTKDFCTKCQTTTY